MKTKITTFIKSVKKTMQKHSPSRAFFGWLENNERYQRLANFFNRYVILLHVLLSLFTCFMLEWLSRHSFISAFYFATEHLGAFLFNSYVIFVIYAIVLLFRKRTTIRMILVAVFAAFGIANCVILLNRVTPFGFTDLNMITDLLTMQNTSYFTAQQAMISAAAILIYTILMVILFRNDKKQKPVLSLPVRLGVVAALFISIPFTTKALISTGVLTSYFGNLAQGYLDYGYVYGFATSMLDRGMKKPQDYSSGTIAELIHETDRGKTERTEADGPNIIIMLLESFFDVSEAKFIETNEDPIPYFHYLEKNYSTGHLTVPVVGAGTCNTEFEILTGMSCQFFGPGEYPQKTILKQTDVESVASDLAVLGYKTHVVHNNGGNFYSRANAFSMMGFDSFSSKEMLDITDYTPIGSWATDDILVGGTKDALDSTKGKDFVYTITVEGHGDYPRTPVEEKDSTLEVTCSGKDDETTNMWTYYTNRIHNVDKFLRDYISMLEERDEDTLFIAFGDHLPTMGLYDHEVKTNDLYQTKYITWNNFGMKKRDADLTSYQLAANYLNRLGVHEGTMTGYNQTMMKKKVRANSNEYMKGLKLLQYDLLYGKRYAYGDDKDLFAASDIVMGSKEIRIDSLYRYADRIHIFGDGFTHWSRVLVNGERKDVEYRSGQLLEIPSEGIKDGDVIVVGQYGSASTNFRSSNAYTFDTNDQ